MILSTLQVAAFGALVSLHIELKPGMNIVLGPNEAGKSTLFKALQHLLLTPVNLHKRRFQELIQPLLPVGGGDTISATLEFRVADQSYRLEKSWGANPAAELRLPDGGRITQAEAVEARLLELLPVHPGTLRNVLLTVQSGLATTLEEIEADKETVYGLSDLLHRSVLETDGVSVGRFQELLDSQSQGYLKNWDLARQRPETKRSGNTRWSQKGTVLETYYALEDAVSRYQEVKGKEASFGTLTEQLESCNRELAVKEGNLTRIEPGAKDAEQRSVLEARLRDTELSLKEVQNDYERWTKGLLRSEALEKELPELEEAVAALELEKKRVQAFLAKKDQIERYQRIRAKREHLLQAEAELKSLLPLPRSQLDRLRDSAAEIGRLLASVKAGNLSLLFHAREAIDLVTQTDIEGPAEQHLAKDKSLTVEADGKIEMHHRNWSIEVYSGKGEFKKVAEQYEQAHARHKKFLKELKIASLEEAVEASRRYEDRRSETQTARAVYEQELGGDTFEALEALCGSSTEPPPSREQSQVLEELVRKQSRVQSLQGELKEIRQTLESLSSQYADKETLFTRIAELGGIKRELTEKTAALVPLPEGYNDAQSLLDYRNRLKEEVESLKREKIRLESDCRNAEENLPDESSEETQRRVEDVREQFDKQLKKAEVLVRIKQAVEKLLEELDEGIYEPFNTLVSRYLATLSDNRYRNVPAGTALPAGVIRADGQTLPYELLSTGTKDLFALALRLAMAEFLLGPSVGFLLLDDPLVDLDPERQRRASVILAEFADKQQLVVFTCQPTHAELLGQAHRIELERS